MFVRNRTLTHFPAALTFLLLVLTVRQSAQGPALSIAPQNPTIVVGQTQQFTATAALAPTGVSAGGEYTCVSLPDGTGIELIRHIRQRDLDSKIVMITAHGSVAITDTAMKSGADDYVIKPVALEELGLLVRRLLSLRRA